MQQRFLIKAIFAVMFEAKPVSEFAILLDFFKGEQKVAWEFYPNGKHL